MAQKISATLAAQMIKETDGQQFFSVTFVKRTTGEVREMLCRKGVTKALKGGTLAYDPTKKNLVGVFDVQADGYRMISLESIKAVKMNGNVFEVVGE